MLKRAWQQHSVSITLPSKRGAILDRNHKPFALNLKVSSVYAVAKDVKNKKEVAKILSSILDKDENFLYERLSMNKQFVWLARKISPEAALRVKSLGVNGIGLLDESRRFYPNGFLASHAIGFAGIDNEGLEGLELLFNKYLKGNEGEKSIARDAKGRHLSFLVRRHIPPVDGCSLILTIDEVIQHITEQALDKAYEKYKAKTATAIVMDPRNGDILAIANRPKYNLNEFSSAKPDARKNTAVCSIFEPGSVFKIVTASACIEENVIAEDDVIFCENGSWYVRRRTLHDHRPHGNLTFKEVIELSSNIGTVKAAMKLGDEKLYNYIKAFGFGQKTEINLPGEISGVVKPVDRWDRFSITSIPMGYGVSATPIQLVAAISVIANKGLLVKPRIISKIIDSRAQTIREFTPAIRARVISEETSGQVKEILEGVVLRGTGKKAALKDYRTAGKTGTAAKIEPTGGYSKNKYIASFVGFAPVEEPVIAIYVMLDEPRPQHYGGTVAAPVFAEIVNATLKYLQIPTKEYKDEDEQIAA